MSNEIKAELIEDGETDWPQEDNPVFSVELSFDEIDTITDALMVLATAFDGIDAAYTAEIVALHNRLTMITGIDVSELN